MIANREERLPRLEGAIPLALDAGPDTSGWETTDFLTYRIDVLHRFQIRETKRMLADNFELTLADWRVLSNLARKAPDTVGAITVRTGIAKSQISRAAASLENRGFVARSDNPADGRTPMFSITPSGRRLYARVMVVGRKRQRQLLAHLKPEQRVALYEALEILTRCTRGDA